MKYEIFNIACNLKISASADLIIAKILIWIC